MRRGLPGIIIVGLLAGCQPARGAAAWHFDFASALLGFAFAWVLVYFMYRNRAMLGGVRDQLVDRTRQLRDDLTSGADRRYRRELGQRAAVLRVGTWTVPLETVYVEPYFKAPLPEPNPFAPLDQTLDWVEWAWPDVRRILPGLPGRLLNPHQVVAGTSRVAIAGEPGAGKSTLLAYLVMVATGTATHANFEFDGEPLPLWAHLADLLEEAGHVEEDPAAALIEAAAQHAGAISGQRLPPLARRRLAEGRCLVLIDGLDELVPTERTVAIAWLERFIKRYGDNRIVVTAPAAGLRSLRALDFIELTFEPWGPRTLQRVAERWASAARARAPRDQEPAAGEDAEAEPARLRVPSWMETPLDVVLWQFLEANRAQTPANRCELYKLAVGVALWTPEKLPTPAPRKSSQSATPFSSLAYLPVASGEDFLAGAAYDSLSSRRSALPWSELELRISDVLAQHEVAGHHDLELLLERLIRFSGLLAQGTHRRVSLVHPVLRDYLAARHVAAFGDAGLLKQMRDDPAWTGALRFYAGLAGPQLGPLVGELLSVRGDVLQDQVFRVAGWAGMAPATGVAWRGAVMAAVARLMLAPGEAPCLRERAAAALVATRDPGVSLLLKRAMVAPEERLRVLAVLGLGALREQAPSDAVSLLVARLGDESPAVRLATAQALSYLETDKAIEELMHVMLTADDILRRIAAESLGAMGGEGHRVLQEGIGDKDYLVRRAAAYGLFIPAAAGHEWATELLQQTEREDTEWFARSAATEGLQRLTDLLTRQQLKLPRVDDIAWLVHWAAQKGQGAGTGEAALQALGLALLDPDARVRAAGAISLAQLAEPTAEEPLRRLAADDPEMDVRQAAVIALAVIRRNAPASAIGAPGPQAPSTG